MSPRPAVLGLIIAAASFLLDQAVKITLLDGFGFADMAAHEAIRVLPFFNLVMVWNPGVSFGLFPAESEGQRFFLLAFSAVVVALLAWWLRGTRDPLVAAGLGLVIGGALGNMVDRVRFGAVADFFHFHAFGYDWYVFNVADAAIVVGVGLLILESLLHRERGETAHPERSGVRESDVDKRGLDKPDLDGRGVKP